MVISASLCDTGLHLALFWVGFAVTLLLMLSFIVCFFNADQEQSAKMGDSLFKLLFLFRFFYTDRMFNPLGKRWSRVFRVSLPFTLLFVFAMSSMGICV